ncbi:MAG: hypothetical protein K5683_02800 [Prevotella sp.]|nr:hypothetical protein [Prevotella sp.]
MDQYGEQSAELRRIYRERTEHVEHEFHMAMRNLRRKKSEAQFKIEAECKAKRTLLHDRIQALKDEFQQKGGEL